MNQKQTDITTGKQIRHLRTQSGMTQEELAHTIDCLRRRFGHAAVIKASYLLDSKLTGFNPKEDHTIHPVSFFR